MEPATLLLWLLSLLLVLAGLAGAVLPLIPGAPLVFAGLWLAAWIDGYARVSGLTVAMLGILVVLALLTDLVAAALGAKRVGASPRAIAGAALGTLAGLFFGLPGLLLGPFVGAVIGELTVRPGVDRAARVGIATWIGLLFGTLAKLALSLAMVGVFALAYFL